MVDELDLVGRVATVVPADPDYYTQARDVTDIEVVEALQERGRTGDVAAFFGTVRVTDQVVSYVKKLVSTNETIDEIPLPMPPVTLETRAVWWTIPPRVIARARVSARDLPGAVHAAEHAAIGLLPLVATCDRWDVGGVSTPMHPDTGELHDLRLRRLPGRRRHQRARATSTPSGGSPPRSRPSRSARALVAARAASSRRSAATATSRLDKTAAASLLAAILGRSWG